MDSNAPPLSCPSNALILLLDNDIVATLDTLILLLDNQAVNEEVMAGEPASLDNIFLSSTDHNYNKTLAAGKLVTLICSVLLFNDCEVGGILAPKELVSENGLVSLPYSCNVDVGSTVF